MKPKTYLMIGDRKINITKDLERYKSVFEIISCLRIRKVDEEADFCGCVFPRVEAVEENGIIKNAKFTFNPHIDTEV